METIEVVGVDSVTVSTSDGILHVTTFSGVDDTAVLAAVDRPATPPFETNNRNPSRHR